MPDPLLPDADATAERDVMRPKRVCRCKCGGWVMGVKDFGRLWTYCTKCTPVQVVKVDRLRPRRKQEARPGLKEKGNSV